MPLGDRPATNPVVLNYFHSRMQVNGSSKHDTDSSLEETRGGRLRGEEMIVDAASATDPPPEKSQQVRLCLLTAIEWAHLGGD